MCESILFFLCCDSIRLLGFAGRMLRRGLRSWRGSEVCSLANKHAACGFGSGFSLSRLLFGFGPASRARALLNLFPHP